MTTYYFDSRAAGPGTGSYEDPFSSLSAAITPSSGDVLSLARGSVFRDSIPTASVAASNMRITSHGFGPKPIVLGSEIVTVWSPTAVPGVFSTTLAGNTGGNVSENAVAMRGVFWTTDLATTAALMTEGSFSFNTSTFTVYIKPTGGTPDGKVYEVAQRLYGVTSTSSFAGMEIDNIEWRGQSRQSVYFFNRSNTTVRQCDFRVIGGANTGSPVGNAVELSGGCNGARVYSNSFEDVFDSPVCFQLYNNSNTIDDLQAYDNTVLRCGLFGVECNIIGSVTNCSITNVLIYRNRIQEAGYAWRPTNVTGRGIHIGASQATSTMRNVRVYENELIDCRWGLSGQLDGCGTNGGVSFTRNKVTTTRSTPQFGGTQSERGMYLSGNVTATSNEISGYRYGWVNIHRNQDGCAQVVDNNTFFNVQIAYGDDSVNPFNGTTVLINNITRMRNNVIWHNGAAVAFISATGTRDVQNNSIRAAGGNITNGMSFDGTNLRPAVFPLTDGLFVPPGSSLLTSGKDLGFVRDMRRRQQRKLIGAYGVAPFRRIA